MTVGNLLGKLRSGALDWRDRLMPFMPERIRRIGLERAPAFVNRERVGWHRNSRGELSFDEATLPWIDRPEADIDHYFRSLAAPEERLRERLASWRERGYVVLEQAVDHALIDAYVADLDSLVADHTRSDVYASHPSHPGTVPVRQLNAVEVRDRHVRFCDFHRASLAGKKLALARPLVSFLRHVFRDQVVAMQSLTFRYGTEQLIHQDYAYVISGIPSHLAAAWIALEDIHPDAGPLGYYPGSHRIRKFNWGNGLFYDEKRSTRHGGHFDEHIRAECARLGIGLETFLPKKGDVFIWHGALAHGGTPQRDPGRTRLSFATHYSTVTAYPRPGWQLYREPTRFELNGAVMYE